MLSTITVDLVLVLVVLAAAAAFLVWNLVARDAKPACHLTGGPRPASSDRGGDVVVGASLARGLERARSRGAERPRSARA